MFCRKCGKELQEGAQFCHECGTPISGAAQPQAQQPQAAPQAQQPQAQPQPQYQYQYQPRAEVRSVKIGKKRPKLLLPILGGVAGVAVVAAVVVLLVSLLGGDAVKVTKALAKSGQAYAAAAEKMELPDLSGLEDKMAYSGEMDLRIEQLEEMPEIEGMGVRMDMDFSMPKRELGLSLTPYYGSAELINAKLKLADEELFIGAEELTGDKFYMVNTLTLMRDIQNMGADMGDAADISFNMFDLMETALEISERNEKSLEALEDDVMEFVKTIEVEKTGKEEIQVNGNTLKCTAYKATITEEALATLLDAVLEVSEEMNDPKANLELYRSMGLPESVIEEIEYSMEYNAPDMDYMFDEIRNALRMLGDLEIDLYLNDGYVVAAICETWIDGTKVEFALHLGGGENYADDLSLSITAEGQTLSLRSTGNHTGEGGIFTDKTAVEFDGETMATMELSYEPKAKNNNLYWEVEVDGTSISLRGQVAGGKNELQMNLEEVSVSQYGSSLMTIGMDYSLRGYEASDINTKNYVAISGMTQDDLMNELMSLEGNVTSWAGEIMNIFPDLMYYFF